MYFKVISISFYLFLLNAINNGGANKMENNEQIAKGVSEFDEHSIVTNNKVFPYMVAILKKSSYVSAGALIDENWVLTAADGLFLTRETMKTLRVRLGSINYKKGGLILPIKLFHIHPFFDDKKPIFDIALIMLPNPVRYTASVHAVRLQKRPKDVAVTHFIITSWSDAVRQQSSKASHAESTEAIIRRRMLSVTHLHPSDPEDCSAELQEININRTDVVMCLDPVIKADPCTRDIGAPVVLNGVLWGIISSWKPVDCAEEPAGISFATLVSADDVESWIHATVHGHRWKSRRISHH